MSLEVKLLESIRDGIQETNQRLDQTNQRLDQTNQKLDSAVDTLGGMIAGTNQRLDQTNQKLDSAVDTLGGLIAGTNERMDKLIAGTNQRIDKTNDRLDRTNDHLDSLDTNLFMFREEVREKFDGVSQLFLADSRHREKFDERIVKLEGRVDRLEGLGETG